MIPYGTPERFRDLDPGQRETLRERAAGEDIRQYPVPAHFQFDPEWAAGLEAAEHRALRDDPWCGRRCSTCGDRMCAVNGPEPVTCWQCVECRDTYEREQAIEEVRFERAREWEQ